MKEEKCPNKPEDPKVDVKKDPRAPAQSLIDQQRGDWEGMGQSRHQPDAPSSVKPIGTPTPGANSLAGEKQK